jgi:hypothetical protein
MSVEVYKALYGTLDLDPPTKDLYEVQVARRKQAYRTVLTTCRQLQAQLRYQGYNTGNGYTKRLLKNGVPIAKHTGE